RTIAPALAFDDVKVAKENLSLLRFRPLVSSAAVFNARGALFATYARADDSRAFPKLPGPDGARVDARDLVLFKRIVSDGEILGTVYLRADYELFSRVYDYLGIAAVVLFAAMLVALLMSSWIQNIVTRPILAIAQVAREVVGQRDYSRRVVTMSADEVGTLVDSFNDMLTEIDRRTRELEACRLGLARQRRGPRGRGAAPGGRRARRGAVRKARGRASEGGQVASGDVLQAVLVPGRSRREHVPKLSAVKNR